MRKNHTFTALFLVVIISLSLLPQSVYYQPGIAKAAGETVQANVKTLGIGPGQVKVSGSKLVNGAGQQFMVMGVNYVGSTDRAWQMWDSGKFDTNIINQDFQKIASLGLNTVRIFVSKSLRDAINNNDFSMLDKVFDLAKNNNILILLAFNDYDEPDLAKEAQLDKKIAARYGTNIALLGFDLKNEPQFGDVVAATFPSGANAPLQKDDFIKAYGERMSQADVDAWRQTSAGKAVVPARMDAHSGYIYANAYKLYLEFLNDSSAWVTKQSGKNSLDYIDSADSAKWKTYLTALDGTVSAWIDARVGPIREADAGSPITIGWSNSLLAKMSSNGKLGFVSLHRFVSEGYSGLITTMNLLNNLQATFSGHPVVLEEFGYSNAKSDGTAVSTTLTANYEAAMWLFLTSKGFAGGLKWMLVNYPSGYNPVENNYGLLDDNGSPKPSYYALKAVINYVQTENQQPAGSLSNITADGTNIVYQYSGTRAVFGNSKSWQSGPVRYSQSTTAPFAAFWPASGTGEIYIMATQPANVTLDLDAIYPKRNNSSQVLLQVNGNNTQSVTPGSNLLSFSASANNFYTVRVPLQPPAFQKATALGGSTRFFSETGHNLGGAFLSYWDKNGGLPIYGYPISEEFTENGYTVQYFERNRFEYHPENKGTKYEVLLGLLGHDITSGREGENTFQRIASFTSSQDRLYFDQTGHSLNFGFKYYWEKHGGLAQFGYPITEEFTELNPADGKTYTVQYFERARFEYHPEYKGTQYETLLGLLGWQVVKGRGWM